MKKAEKIILFPEYRLGYFELFDKNGNRKNDKYVTVEGSKFKRVFWRFYKLI